MLHRSANRLASSLRPHTSTVQSQLAARRSFAKRVSRKGQGIPPFFFPNETGVKKVERENVYEQKKLEKEKLFQETLLKKNLKNIEIDGEALHGIHSVRQALESNFRQFNKIIFREAVKEVGRKKGNDKKKATQNSVIEEIKALALERKIPFEYTSKWMLNHIVENKPHQGVILDASPIKSPHVVPQEPSKFPVRDTKSSRPPLILACDEMFDPQNFGAILRSALFLGCDMVISSAKNSVPVNATVSRASAGAAEVLASENRLMVSNNLNHFLLDSRGMGWQIVGTSADASSISSNEFELKKPTILVMGNEHYGLRTSVQRSCEKMVKIPVDIDAAKSRVDSLNLSVATGIMLYQLLHR